MTECAGTGWGRFEGVRGAVEGPWVVLDGWEGGWGGSKVGAVGVAPRSVLIIIRGLGKRKSGETANSGVRGSRRCGQGWGWV